LLILALPSNIADLIDGADQMERTSQYTRAELGAMQLSQKVISPEYTPSPSDLAGVTIPAAPYFAMVALYRSSPADSYSEILQEPEFARRRADRILAMAFHLRLVRGAEETELDRCMVISDGATAHIPVSRQGLAVRDSGAGVAKLSLRQFARTFPVDLGHVGESGEAVLQTDPNSYGPYPWVLKVAAQGGNVTVCRLSSSRR
jgi:hypothetical protein